MKIKLPILFAPGLAVALNADTTLPEWIQLAPYGEHPTSRRDKVQVFNRVAAEGMVTHFNAIWQVLKRKLQINALPVWVGHPDFDEVTWPEKINLGNVTDLEARADGLYGKVQWNAEAPEIIESKGCKFPSAAWECEDGDNNTTHPLWLWSVGMCARPNIKSVQAVCNALPEETEDDPETEEQTTQEKEDPEPMNPKLIAALIAAGILAEGITDEAEIIAAVESYKKPEAEKTALTDEEKAALEKRAADAEAGMTTATNAAAALKTTHINALIEFAIETGRVSKADSATLLTEINAMEPEKALEAIKTRKPQLNSQRLAIGGQRPAILDAHQRITQLNAWVEKRMAETNCSYDAAWQASQADPAMKVIHEAMDKGKDA
jgi:hypothetical protein